MVLKSTSNLKFRRDDLVGLRNVDNKRFKFGHVVSDEDEEVQVVWHADTNTKEGFSKCPTELKLSDRPFRPGDFVREISDGKVGYVQTVHKFASVKLLDGKENVIAVNVATKDLHSPKLLNCGDHILYDRWVGKVVKVHRSVHLSTDASPQIRYEKKTHCISWDSLETFSSGNDEFGRSKMFYVGLKLVNREWKDLPPSPIPKMTREEFLNSVITEICIDHVDVKWIKCLREKGNLNVTQAPPKQTFKGNEFTFRRLSPFENLTVHLGSIRNLTLDDKSVVVPEINFRRNPFSPVQYFQRNNIVETVLREKSCLTICVQVVKTTSLVQVVWLAGGTVSTISSCELTDQLQGPSFFPGLHVYFQKIEKGILQTVDMTNKMVTLETRKADKNDRLISASLYDVTENPNSNLRVGNVVVVHMQSKEMPLVLGYILCTCPDGRIAVMSDTYVEMKDYSDISYVYTDNKATGTVQRTYEHSASLKKMEWTKDDRISLIKNAIKSTQKLNFHPCVPLYHSFYGTPPENTDSAKDLKSTMASELEMLTLGAESLPINIMAFNNRCDMYSVLLCGPPNTPYENVLFCFDLFIPAHYPQVPPLLRYKAVKGQFMIHKFIGTDGVVHLPILKNKFWKCTSNIALIFQFIYDFYLVERPSLMPDFNWDDVSITSIDAIINQICNATASSNFDIKAREENEILLINLLDLCMTMLQQPMSIWRNVILLHFKKCRLQFFQKVLEYVNMAPNEEELKLLTNPVVRYPLFPLTKGGRLSMATRLNQLVVLIGTTCLHPLQQSN